MSVVVGASDPTCGRHRIQPVLGRPWWHWHPHPPIVAERLRSSLIGAPILVEREKRQSLGNSARSSGMRTVESDSEKFRTSFKSRTKSCLFCLSLKHDSSFMNRLPPPTWSARRRQPDTEIYGSVELHWRRASDPGLLSSPLVLVDEGRLWSCVDGEMHLKGAVIGD